MTDAAPAPIPAFDAPEPETVSEAAAETPPAPPAAVDMAALLAARLCHDFISPASAIVSGLDLLEDPTAQDMREEAMSLIATSAKKLADLLQFSRVAFGASSQTEVFDVRALESLAKGVFAHVRAEMDWKIEPESLGRGPARALLNMAQIGAAALPMGGIAKIRAVQTDGQVVISIESEGTRPRLKPEVLAGLRGEPFGEGLSGQWIQGAYLHEMIKNAGGRLAVEVTETAVTLAATIPA
ncbi:MAG: chpT [Caulobacter sp.]|jgi:histidine phosphotransferase ChpT|nr:chpT [Caulobacter sp.]